MKNPCADRLRAARRQMRRRDLNALLITNPIDVSYLSGFTGEASWLLVRPRGATLMTDGRFAEQAVRDAPGLRVVVRRGALVDALAKELGRARVGRVGFDPDAVSVALRSRLAKSLRGVRLVRAPDGVGTLRLCKDAWEQRAIRRAVRVAEEAWAAFRKTIRPGLTEQRLAAELDHAMRLAGADGPAFPTICAVDASSAMPHVVPGVRRLGRGSVLLVDFGARVAGYVSDLTRVLFAGRIAPRVREAYEVVLVAQKAGLARVGPNVAPAAVDKAVREVIKDAGFGRAFTHGTGHGIGREVHEAPFLGPEAPREALKPGMVVTIEPGVYFKGRFGIRIEDDCLVTRTGRQVLSRLEKDLEAMVL